MSCCVSSDCPKQGEHVARKLNIFRKIGILSWKKRKMFNILQFRLLGILSPGPGPAPLSALSRLITPRNVCHHNFMSRKHDSEHWPLIGQSGRYCPLIGGGGTRSARTNHEL